jgi:hypothetical protein
VASKAELRRREELARFNAEIMELRGDELLDRIIAFDALPPPDSSEQNLRRAMRYSIGAALIKEFGVGKGDKAKVARLAALREAKTHEAPLSTQKEGDEQ